MAKLTKAEIKRHDEALQVLEKETLSHDEKIFIMENWQESADHVNSRSGAFFTPWKLAADFALEMNGSAKVLDLCAGIGALSYAYMWRSGGETSQGREVSITCVELNPSYVEVGKKILPEADWIESDVFELHELGDYDIVISNPPFGAIGRTGEGPKYSGKKFEYHIIDIASRYADYGAFIIPRMSAGFATGGQEGFRRNESRELAKFKKETGIHLDVGIGIEASDEQYGSWKGTAPMVEVCCAYFDNK